MIRLVIATAAAVLAASSTPEETTYEPWTWRWFADWVIGTPLRVTAIVLAAYVLRWVLHRSINGIVARAGATSPPKRLFGSRRAAEVLVGTTGLYSERRAQRARTLASLARSIVSAVVLSIAGVMVLTELGFDVAPLIASAGIVGVALGFGAQSLVKDFINGVFMLAEDQYGVGDLIDMGQATGIVEGVGLRVTRLRDADGAVWYVRNGEVVRVANKSQDWGRATVDVGVLPAADLARVRSLLLEVGEGLAAEPAWAARLDGEPEVLGLQHVAGDVATVRLTVRTKPLEADAVARELRERAYRRLEDQGVPLPGTAPAT